MEEEEDVFLWWRLKIEGLIALVGSRRATEEGKLEYFFSLNWMWLVSLVAL